MSTFHSTRSSDEAFTSKQAIRKGIADDGGLFVTDALGETKIDISDLAGKSYQQIALTVLSVLLDDYTEEELSQCIAEAYGSQWSDERITPVKPLGNDFIMEDVRQKIESIDGVTSATINLVFEPEWDKDMMSEEAKLELGFL